MLTAFLTWLPSLACKENNTFLSLIPLFLWAFQNIFSQEHLFVKRLWKNVLIQKYVITQEKVNNSPLLPSTLGTSATTRLQCCRTTPLQAFTNSPHCEYTYRGQQNIQYFITFCALSDIIFYSYIIIFKYVKMANLTFARSVYCVCWIRFADFYPVLLRFAVLYL